MKLFEALNRWIDRSRGDDRQGRRAVHPPRPEVLRPPESEERLRVRAREVLAAVEAANEAADRTPCGKEGRPGRYRAKPSWQDGGPRWDPYAEDQSTAARVQSRRRARPPVEGQAMADRLHAGSEKSPPITHYQILGVKPDATLEQIEQAYRRYAAAIHPDKFFDDPEARTDAERKLRDLNVIMQILRDQTQRALYDASL